MPAHIVYGDSFLASRRIADIRRQAGLTNLSEAAEPRMKAQEADAGQVISTCRAMPFLEPSRLVIIEGALATRERRSSAAERKNATEWNRLAKEIPEMPASQLKDAKQITTTAVGHGLKAALIRFEKQGRITEIFVKEAGRTALANAAMAGHEDPDLKHNADDELTERKTHAQALAQWMNHGSERKLALSHQQAPRSCDACCLSSR